MNYQPMEGPDTDTVALMQMDSGGPTARKPRKDKGQKRGPRKSTRSPGNGAPDAQPKGAVAAFYVPIPVAALAAAFPNATVRVNGRALEVIE